MQSQSLVLVILIQLSFTVALCAAHNSNQYVCNTAYQQSRYANSLGRTHVPFGCVVSAPSDCPRSWKAGVIAGRSTAEPLIDVDFIKCMEGFSECGYVPIIKKTGAVVGNSGVTIGIGVDLGSRDRISLSALGVRNFKLEPYFGLQRDDAACAVIESPLVLTSAEATSLSIAVKNEIIATIAIEYNAQRKSDTLPFSSLPRGARTAIASILFQYDRRESRVQTFWGYVISNNWEEAIKELRDFGDNFPMKRNYEADILEAAVVNCSRSIDAVFLLDESGSISDSDFQLSLDFIQGIINTFPSENIGGDSGTNFGFSLFSSYYRSVFSLSMYDSKYQYLSAISSVHRRSGGTNLGAALTQILPDLFNELQGLRPEDRAIPRILIVITDGESHDLVVLPAENIRNKNIVIYAIGVGNYDEDQLSAMASSSSHIYTLTSFQNLADFAGTLTAASCHESRPVNLNMKITASVKKDAYQYYSFDLNKGQNLMIEVNDTSGSTLMYASRDNPHPYKFDNVFGFTYSISNKIIIISPTTKSSDNNQQTTQASSQLGTIYISVTAETETATFELEATVCDPSECSEGTNKGFRLKVSTIMFGLAIAVSFSQGMTS